MPNRAKSKWRALTTWWGRNSYTDALTEFVIVFVLSNLPFGALVLGHFLKTVDSQFSVLGAVEVIRTNWRPGEILILVSTLLAPVFYVITKYHRARRHMTGYTLLLFVLGVMYFISSVLFAYDRLDATANRPFERNLALGLFGGAILIWYIGLVFQRKLENPPIDKLGDAADRIANQLGQEPQ